MTPQQQTEFESRLLKALGLNDKCVQYVSLDTRVGERPVINVGFLVDEKTGKNLCAFFEEREYYLEEIPRLWDNDNNELAEPIDKA